MMMMRIVPTTPIIKRQQVSAIVLICVIAAFLTGCAGTADRPSIGASAAPSSESPVVGLDSYTFEGTGRNLETETVDLSGNYLVTWEVTNNYFEDSGYEAAFAVTYFPSGSQVPIIDENEIGEGTGTLQVDDLEGGNYHLKVWAGDEAEWSVTFERP